MVESTLFKDMERLRDADIITPPNYLKEKVGSGGLNPQTIKKAENFIESNDTNFQPIAESYFSILDDAVIRLAKNELKGEQGFEAVLYPLAQLKAQGSMFKYPMVTEIAGMLINFLEVIETLDDDAVSIVNAHKVTLRAILTGKLPGNIETDEGRDIIRALKGACLRYFQSKN